MATATKPVKKRKNKKPASDRIKKGVIRRALATDKPDSEAFESWAKYLSKRASPQSVADLCGSEQSPLLWCLAPEITASLNDSAIIQFSRKTKRRPKKKATKSKKKLAITDSTLAEWLDSLSRRPDEPALAIELLWLSHELPKLAQTIAPETWNRLLQELIESARIETTRPTTCPWTVQLLSLIHI